MAISTGPYAQDLEQMSQDWSKTWGSRTSGVRRGGDQTKTKNKAFPAFSSPGAEGVADTGGRAWQIFLTTSSATLDLCFLSQTRHMTWRALPAWPKLVVVCLVVEAAAAAAAASGTLIP